MDPRTMTLRSVRGRTLGLAAAAALLAIVAGAADGDWRTASRAPVGLAPDPATTREAVVQVYGARALRWRGYFGVHTWIAVKATDAPAYTVYEVIGWRLRWSDRALVVHQRAPDGRWFGNEPELLAERRGEGVDAMIERIASATRDYPYSAEYRLWPGPNSNTFTAWIGRAVPELGLDLPPTAIGKDFVGARVVGRAPSGSWVQLSLYGLLGVLASDVEGVEVNVLGLSFGVNPFSPSLKVPMVGRLGVPRHNGVVSPAP
jgi:hypothetical protein